MRPQDIGAESVDPTISTASAAKAECATSSNAVQFRVFVLVSVVMSGSMVEAGILAGRDVSGWVRDRVGAVGPVD